MNIQSENYLVNDDIMKEDFSLRVPPSAVTSDSVALVWGKTVGAYSVYMNGQLVEECSKTSCTVSGLKPDTEYAFFVSCRDRKTNEVKVRTKSKTKILNILDFGAVSDGKTLSTAAIQSAINACGEGETVYVPQGNFVSGAVFLHGNMTFCVDGHLLGSDDDREYPVFKYRFEGREEPCYSSLINTADGDMENITLCGSGVIDGNGKKLCPNELKGAKGSRGRTVCIRNTNGLYIKDITIRNAPAWCTHIIYCENISVNNVKIYSKKDESGVLYDLVNGDGLDPDSVKNMYIFDSLIESEDDCIAIKSGRDAEGREIGIASENIYVMNCTFRCGFGVAMGSEASGGIKNVLVRDCVFEDTFSVGSVKSPRGRGGIIENIRYSDCTHYYGSGEFTDCEWFRGAIYIDNFYSKITFDPSEKCPADEGTPKIRNIIFENIELSTVGGNAIYLSGLPESPLEGIYLKNISAKGKFGLKAYNIRGLKTENVSVKSDGDADWQFTNIE